MIPEGAVHTGSSQQVVVTLVNGRGPDDAARGATWRLGDRVLMLSVAIVSSGFTLQATMVKHHVLA